jgi:hypothetical protein
MKRCTKCSQDKSADAFSRCAQSKDGLQYWCKTCLMQSRREWAARNPSGVAKLARDRYYRLKSENPTKWAAINAKKNSAYKARHPEKEAARLRRKNEVRRDELRDDYLRRLLRHTHGISDPTDCLVGAYRSVLKVKRLIWSKRNEQP